MFHDQFLRACVFGGLSFAVSLGVCPAFAQVYNTPAQAPENSYGGGFLELLLTGGIANAPSAGAVYQQPAPAYAAPAPVPANAAPVGTSAATSARAYSALAPANGASPAAAAPDPQSVARSVDPMYQRQQVDYDGAQKPGTIIIDTANKFLYLVEKDRKAMRYGIGVGRQGFTWSGIEQISRKAEWPDWTPPADMLARRPDLPTHMEGGPQNPLGARALYLGASLYRIHGTNEPNTIGTNVSSGCIRMMNQDVEDLYDRVGVGTKVVVM
jgi:lipoprotein-anchoring transpeptidase ErfK/SrfK